MDGPAANMTRLSQSDDGCELLAAWGGSQFPNTLFTDLLFMSDLDRARSLFTQGVELFEVTSGDGGSWEADPEGFASLLAEHGVSMLPNPPIALPEWMEDVRRDLTGLVPPAG